MIKRKWLARLWFWLGVYGAARYSFKGIPGPNIAQLVPVIYFLSVYANYATEKSTQQGLMVQVKQEEAEKALGESQES